MPNYMLDTGQGGVVRVYVYTWRNVWGFYCRLMDKFGAVALSYLPDAFIDEGIFRGVP